MITREILDSTQGTCSGKSGIRRLRDQLDRVVAGRLRLDLVVRDAARRHFLRGVFRQEVLEELVHRPANGRRGHLVEDARLQSLERDNKQRVTRSSRFLIFHVTRS